MRNFIYRLFWGLFFLACAAYAIASQLGVLSYRLSFWSILGTVIFALSLIDGLINVRIAESVFSVAFLLMVYAGPLHLTKLVPWTILLAALLVTIGLGIIFRNRFHSVVYANRKIRNLRHKREGFLDNILTEKATKESGSHVVIDQELSDSSRYLDSQELERVDVRARMSEINLYLDQANAAGEQVQLNLDLSMSSLTVYLPLSWQVDSNLSDNSLFGDLEIDGDSNGGGPTLVLNGHSSMSEIKIEYV